MGSFVQALFLTDAFFWRIYGFKLKLKDNPKDIDKKDHEFGEIVVDLLQKQFAKMTATRYKFTDIVDLLQAFPAEYRSGEQQDVTETMRFVFDKLGGCEQSLLKEIFGGQLQEKIRCKECGKVRVREETFTDLVVPIPTEEAVKASGIIPNIQMLLEQLLQFEEMDTDNLVECEHCNHRKTQSVKWTETTSPPRHLCLCLNRFTFDVDKMDFTKNKSPVKVDSGLHIGPYEYELYHAIIHTGQNAYSGHYYSIGKRSEQAASGNMDFRVLNDARVMDLRNALLSGVPKELPDDNVYVVFLRCKQAPATPELRVPLRLMEFVEQQDNTIWERLAEAHGFDPSQAKFLAEISSDSIVWKEFPHRS